MTNRSAEEEMNVGNEIIYKESKRRGAHLVHPPRAQELERVARYGRLFYEPFQF